LEVGVCFEKKLFKFALIYCVKVHKEKLEVRRTGTVERAEELEVYETVAG
jgi:hypothetical protein